MLLYCLFHTMFLIAYLLASFVLSVSATPYLAPRAADPSVQLQNGEDASSQNSQFRTLGVNSSCTSGQVACIEGSFALCAALPLTNGPGTTVTCTTQDDLDARMKAAGVNIAAGDNSTSVDSQTSLKLDPRVICTNFENDGQNETEPGQTPSSTSSNNFINYCLTVDKPLTNGQQLTNGSCNPTPMGVLPAITHMPSSKFQFPLNQAELPAKTAFTAVLAVAHLETGFFTNATANFLAAPQQVGTRGDIRGHSHVVIEKLESMTQTVPTNPREFVYFKGLNAAGSILIAEVTGGLEEGTYRMASITTAANHQPVNVPIAQHGSLNDVIYKSNNDNLNHLVLGVDCADVL
ncbi:hypothetical protein EIP91_003789 [Steccherinum ochraceum]|uniref:Uncharacterized protein n=1 Tax=Steccherinum ochraceum TaxID=92696 RepID=A0A4R0RG90_9APHY|nr:hypothetical protein EIP91_003789 [Steccherinum ochraceum]